MASGCSPFIQISLERDRQILPFYPEGKVLFGYTHVLIQLEYVLGANSLLVPHYYCLLY